VPWRIEENVLEMLSTKSQRLLARRENVQASVQGRCECRGLRDRGVMALLSAANGKSLRWENPRRLEPPLAHGMVQEITGSGHGEQCYIARVG